MISNIKKMKLKTNDIIIFGVFIFSQFIFAFSDTIDDIIQKMSIQEKIGQLSQIDIQAAIDWSKEDGDITIYKDGKGNNSVKDFILLEPRRKKKVIYIVTFGEN